MRRALSDPPILALMVGQTFISAGLYYSFPALVLDWRAEFGWSVAQTMGAFSLALVVQGLVAQQSGHFIDKGLAVWSMAGGALLGAFCLGLLTYVDTLWQFYLLWGVLGLAMGLTLYEAVFALVIRARDKAARDSITAITLAAGFASSFAYLMTGYVSQLWDWKAAIWVLAALVVLVNLPLTFFAARQLEKDKGQTKASLERSLPEGATETSAPKPSMRPGFWPLTLGISLSALAIGIFTTHLLPLLLALGAASATAIFAAALVGPSQVIGRLLMVFAGKAVAARNLAIAGLAGMALGALMLLGATIIPFLVFAFALVYGVCYGVTSILRPLIIREALGSSSFGVTQGAVLKPAFFVFAAAPFVAAMVADAGGYVPVVLLCILALALGAVMLLSLPKPEHPD